MISVLNQFCGINAKARPTITSGKKRKKKKRRNTYGKNLYLKLPQNRV